MKFSTLFLLSILTLGVSESARAFDVTTETTDCLLMQKQKTIFKGKCRVDSWTHMSESKDTLYIKGNKYSISTFFGWGTDQNGSEVDLSLKNTAFYLHKKTLKKIKLDKNNQFIGSVKDENVWFCDKNKNLTYCYGMK